MLFEGSVVGGFESLRMRFSVRVFGFLGGLWVWGMWCLLVRSRLVVGGLYGCCGGVG